MKVGVLGTGFGAFHASIYHRLGADVVLCGRDPIKLNQLREQTGIAVTSKIEDIYGDAEIGLIDICLPNSLHAEYSIRALEQDKNVFCETPLCTQSAECNAILEAIRRNNAKLFVNQFTKFIPEYRYVYETVRSKRLGELCALRAWRNTPSIWGSLGVQSISTNLMIHELDFATWLKGTPVSVNSLAVSKNADEAHVEATLQYDTCMMSTSASSLMPQGYPFTCGFVAEFEKGAIEYTARFDQEDAPAKTVFEYSDDHKHAILLPPVDPYEAAIQHVIECCASGNSSDCGAGAAVLVAQTAIQIREQIV